MPSDTPILLGFFIYSNLQHFYECNKFRVGIFGIF